MHNMQTKMTHMHTTEAPALPTLPSGSVKGGVEASLMVFDYLLLFSIFYIWGIISPTSEQPFRVDDKARQ